MARHALLVGVSEFADERLARLNAPVNDVTALRGILADSGRGNFDSVELSLNEDFLAVRDRLSRFFHDRTPDDLLLLYYSGHGILGRGNRLFLATAGSNLDTPRDRSVSAKEVREFIEESRAERQIIVLDCCHSGAFAEHAKSVIPAPAVTPETFSGGDAGLYVLTAADALQFAWDGADLRAGSETAGGFSQFTSWLVEGLEKGEPAPDDDQITMDALYRYLFRRARSAGSAATPQRFVQGGVGDLVISRNPLAGSAQIDSAIVTALAANEYRLRLGAVAELALKIDEGHRAAARAARLLLQRQLQHERDFLVRAAITKALGEELKEPSERARPYGAGGVEAELAEAIPGLQSERPPSALPAQPIGEAAGQYGLRAPREDVFVGNSPAPRSRLLPLGRKVARYVHYFLLWPTYFARIPTLLKPLIVTVWLLSLLSALYWMDLMVTGALDQSVHTPILHSPTNLVPGGPTQLLR
jgi:hypothetical protein